MSDLPGSAKQNKTSKKKSDDAFVKAFVGAGGSKKQSSKVSVSGGGSKERVVRERQERTPITEYTRKVDIEPEVESWMEKLEKENEQLDKPVTDDQGQTVLDDIDDVDDKKKPQFKVVLPMTKEEMEKGLHHKVASSARWLAEWCIRMIKMFHGKVAYKRQDEPDKPNS